MSVCVCVCLLACLDQGEIAFRPFTFTVAVLVVVVCLYGILQTT